MEDASSTQPDSLKVGHDQLDTLEALINDFLQKHPPDPDNYRKFALDQAVDAIDEVRYAITVNNIGRAVEQSVLAGVVAGSIVDTAIAHLSYSQAAGKKTKNPKFWIEIEDKARMQTRGNRTDSEIADQLLSWYLDNHSDDKGNLPAPATLRKRIGKWRAEEQSKIDQNN